MKGYDLTGIDKSEEAVLFDPSIAHNLSQQIKSQTSFQSMKELFDSIKDSWESHLEDRNKDMDK